MPDEIVQPAPDSDYLMSLPTELRHVMPAFRTTTTAAVRQVMKLRGWASLKPLPARRGRGDGNGVQQRLIVELRRMKFHHGAIVPAPGKPVACMSLGPAIAADGGEGIIDRCLSTLAGLNTDCFMTLLALVQMASKHDGVITDNISEIGRRRGWDPSELDNRSRPLTRTRRERLREHLELLSQVEFCITSLAEKRSLFVAFPLFQYFARRGEHGVQGRDQTLYRFHPLFWDEMTVNQRVVFLDEALLTADPRRDEWPVRLAWYMSSRWAPSWVSKSLDKNGGRLQERLGVILAGACIEHGPQLQKQGRPWLRRQFRCAMDRLATWSPRSLIGGYEIAEDAKSPLEDRVTFWPTKTVADRLTSARTQSIARRESRSRRPRFRGRSKRSKDQ